MGLTDYSYEKTRAIYNKYFSTGNLNLNLESKLALIAMICFITNSINKNKDPLDKVTCYQVICKIGKDFPDEVRYDFFKALGVICDDFMYDCKEFPTFGVEPKAMPKEVLKLLNSWMPF
jgi:hypothetical protein